MNDLTALAEAALWPLVAIVLVLLGATFATSGRPGTAATRTQRRAEVGPPGATTTSGRPCGGRRATDHLPGNRLMVVIAGGDGDETVRSAVDAARRAGSGVTVVGDATAAAREDDGPGTRTGQVIAVNSRA